MSILIKGMEMPITCDDCRLNNGISCYAVPEYTEDCVVGRTDDRPDWCPLIEVPPHGRLIDADKFLKLCEDYAITPSDNEFCKHLEFALTRASTIIEAEENADG